MKISVDHLSLPACDGCASLALSQQLFLVAEQIGRRHGVTPALMGQALVEAACAWACCVARASDDGPLEEDGLQATVVEFERALRFAASWGDEPAEHQH